ncbi:hypothetical protein [Kribbella sp. HUAS MG21]|uniref:Lipoprotein LprG n=1 Tax=Kribbella sp. HUAS MG21 TaxID=3160966 RepID=A0AAU7TL48_9ACTN
MKFRAAVATAAAVPLALGLTSCAGEPAATGYRPSAPVDAPLATKKPIAHLNQSTFVPAMKRALTRQKTWRITGTVTANGTTLMSITGVQSAKPQAVSIVMSGAAFEGRTARIIGLGKTAYLSLPGKTPAGKYLKVDVADIDPASAVGSALNSADPTKAYEHITKAMRNVRYVGTRTVDGRELAQYDLILDTATVLKLSGAKPPQGVPETMTYSLWMDSAHVVRRMTGDLLGIAVELTMTDYNKPVRITAPPAGKLVR